MSWKDSTFGQVFEVAGIFTNHLIPLKHLLGGAFKHVLFSPIPGEDSQFD